MGESNRGKDRLVEKNRNTDQRETNRVRGVQREIERDRERERVMEKGG